MPLLPTEIGSAEYITLHVRKTAPCAAYWSGDGSAVLKASTTAALGNHFFAYDDADTLTSQCGPCEAGDPNECKCAF